MREVGVPCTGELNRPLASSCARPTGDTHGRAAVYLVHQPNGTFSLSERGPRPRGAPACMLPASQIKDQRDVKALLTDSLVKCAGTHRKIPGIRAGTPRRIPRPSRQRSATRRPARGLRRLYYIHMGEELERAEPRSYAAEVQEGVQTPRWRRVIR